MTFDTLLHVLFRSAGGAFGKMEHAHEEQYFRKLVGSFVKMYNNHVVKMCYYGNELFKLWIALSVG